MSRNVWFWGSCRPRGTVWGRIPDCSGDTRGTNENTNGLLRQYFPKGTDLSGYSQRYLDRIALRLNTRPRKTLGYRTPAVTLADTVASTG